MKIAYVHELWKAGAGRCVSDLLAVFAKTDEVLLVPDEVHATPAAIWAQLRAFRPDVVHCHSFYGTSGLPYADLAALSRLAPTVFTVHDPRPIGIFHDHCWDCPHYRTCMRCPLASPRARLFPPANTYFRTRLKKIIAHRRAHGNLRIVSPSLWIQARLRASELGRFHHVHIPNGVDLALFSPGAPAHPFRRDLPPGALVILHVAHPVGLQVNPRKGLEDLWTAFHGVVLPAYPQSRLAVIGEGAVPNHPAVLPLGPVEPADLPRYFSASDLYVTATRADNLPYTVLEAMACGRPVVGTRIGGVPEMIHDGVSGRLVPARNPIELGRTIADLLGRPDAREQMGRAGREIAIREFGLDLFAARYRHLYAEVCRDVSG